MMKFAVCDDEPFMIEKITEELSAYMTKRPLDSYQIETYADSVSLLESRCDFDLLFLDIRMRHPDGMETARLLRKRKYSGLLVFVTVLKELVFDAFEVQALDYLLKPLDSRHFRKTMDRAVLSLKEQKGKNILIKKGKSYEIIPMPEITYCEVQGRKIYIHQTGGKVADCYEKLEDFEKRLDSRFFRCHRSFIVNLGCVRGCTDGQIVLPCGGRIPVSRLREQDFAEALLCYMKRREF